MSEQNVQRFYTHTVSLENGGVFEIRDRQAHHYKMPEKAISINFGDAERAAEVCYILNREWWMFIGNPK